MDRRPQPRARVVWLAALALLGGCAAYKEGITIDTVANSRTPSRDLVRYLEATAAEPAVCNGGRRDGPSVRLVTKGVIRAVNRAFEEGTVPLERWEACTHHMWLGPDPFVRDALRDSLVGQLGDITGNKALATDIEARARAHAVLRVARDRPPREPLDPADVTRLRRAATKRLARAEGRHAKVLQDLISLLELEEGLADGQPVTADRIQAATRQAELIRWARRLPDPQLATAAGERLVRLRAQTSAFASVRDDLDNVVDRVLSGGRNALPDNAPGLSARWEPGHDDTVLLRLLQIPDKDIVKLLPSARDETRTPDASVDLRGTLWVRVEGLEEEVTLCPPADPWDPTPCIAPEALKLAHPVAALTPTGRIRFDRDVGLDDVLKLGSDGDRLAAQVVVAGIPATIDLPIFFDSIPEMEYKALGQGRPLWIRLWELSNERLLVQVREEPGKGGVRVLVPMDDAAFYVHTLAGQGVPEEGEFFRGGHVRVVMHCTNCPAVRAWAQDHIKSVGVPHGQVKIRRAKDSR